MIFARIERAEKGLSNAAKIIKNGALDLEIGNVFVTNLVKNPPHLTRIFVTIFRPRNTRASMNATFGDNLYGAVSRDLRLGFGRVLHGSKAEKTGSLSAWFLTYN